MIKYKKGDHITSPRIGRITTSQGVIINPSEEQLIAAGYEVYDMEEVIDYAAKRQEQEEDRVSALEKLGIKL